MKTIFISRLARRAPVTCNTRSKTARKVTHIAGVLFLSSIRYFNTHFESHFLFVLGVFTWLYRTTAFRTAEQN